MFKHDLDHVSSNISQLYVGIFGKKFYRLIIYSMKIKLFKYELNIKLL